MPSAKTLYTGDCIPSSVNKLYDFRPQQRQRLFNRDPDTNRPIFDQAMLAFYSEVWTGERIE
jgi:hypothetical protein